MKSGEKLPLRIPESSPYTPDGKKSTNVLHLPSHFFSLSTHFTSSPLLPHLWFFNSFRVGDLNGEAVKRQQRQNPNVLPLLPAPPPCWPSLAREGQVKFKHWGRQIPVYHWFPLPLDVLGGQSGKIQKGMGAKPVHSPAGCGILASVFSPASRGCDYVTREGSSLVF